MKDQIWPWEKRGIRKSRERVSEDQAQGLKLKLKTAKSLYAPWLEQVPKSQRIQRALWAPLRGSRQIWARAASGLSHQGTLVSPCGRPITVGWGCLKETPRPPCCLKCSSLQRSLGVPKQEPPEPPTPCSQHPGRAETIGSIWLAQIQLSNKPLTTSILIDCKPELTQMG